MYPVSVICLNTELSTIMNTAKSVLRDFSVRSDLSWEIVLVQFLLMGNRLEDLQLKLTCFEQPLLCGIWGRPWRQVLLRIRYLYQQTRIWYVFIVHSSILTGWNFLCSSEIPYALIPTRIFPNIRYIVPEECASSNKCTSNFLLTVISWKPDYKNAH